MKQINALIIDDEISAVNTLRGMLAGFCPQINVKGHASSVKEALDSALRLKPELVFLDIEMPPFGNAFDFLKQIKEIKFGVIFTTAYPQYAIQAIKAVQPWSYLVKPYSVRELVEAVELAQTKLEESGMRLTEPEEQQLLVLHDARKGDLVLRIPDIICCRTENATVDVMVQRKGQLEKVVTYRSLKELEAELPEHLFCRTHHSYLVNMSHIERIERTGRNGVIHMPNNIRVHISVQRMGDFEQKFQDFLQK